MMSEPIEIDPAAHAWLGVTGTREGMTDAQRSAFVDELELAQRLWQVVGLRHGDCVGVDAQAAGAVRWRGLLDVAHPPSDDRLRAYVPAWHVEAPLPYLERNRAIVCASVALVACPRTRTGERRSGTWSTVRYVRQLGRPVALIHPDGQVVHERYPDPAAFTIAQGR